MSIVHDSYMLVHGVRTFKTWWVYIDACVQETWGSKTPFHDVRECGSSIAHHHHIPHVTCPQFHAIRMFVLDSTSLE
jgi:hypothetical protein